MDFALRAAVESAAQEKVVEASHKKSFPVNMDAALYQTADNMSLGDIKSDEVRFTHDGETYIAQGYTEGILYVREGDWGNIRKIAWPVAAASTSSMGEGSASAGSGGGTTLESSGSEGGASAGASKGERHSRFDQDEASGGLKS
jgi:hypothetical protein